MVLFFIQKFFVVCALEILLIFLDNFHFSFLEVTPLELGHWRKCNFNFRLTP